MPSARLGVQLVSPGCCFCDAKLCPNPAEKAASENVACQSVCCSIHTNSHSPPPAPAPPTFHLSWIRMRHTGSNAVNSFSLSLSRRCRRSLSLQRRRRPPKSIVIRSQRFSWLVVIVVVVASCSLWFGKYSTNHESK